MKKYIIMIVASLMAIASKAQTISVEEERGFYQKVYALFTEYAQSASLSDEAEQYTFRKLFANGEMLICNDLMSLDHSEKLSVDEYISILQDAKRVKVVVRNIKKDGAVEDAGDAWVVPIAFEKGMSYSKSGTLFSSFDYFGKYYRLRAELSLNKTTGECYISKLEADPQHEWLSFPEKFVVLERTREDDNKRNYKRDSKLTINGQEINWNLYGQIILHDDDKVKYNNSLVDLEIITAGKGGGTKIRAKYNDKAFRVRANVGYSLSDFNTLADIQNDANISVSDNKEMSFGVDVGYVFPSTSKFYFGIFTGLNMSSSNFTMNMAPDVKSDITDIKECTADEDGDKYTRRYVLSGNGVSQKLKATNMTIPLYGDFEYQMTPLLSVYADLGVKFQLSSGTWSAYIDDYETSGFYKDYGNVEIKGGLKGEDVNLNGFGEWEGRDMEVDEEGMEKSMSIHALAGLGLRFNLNKSFAFDAGVQYMTSGTSWKINKSKDSIFDYEFPVGATTPEAKAEAKAQGDKVNLMRKTSGLKNGAFRVTASLIYKF